MCLHWEYFFYESEEIKNSATGGIFVIHKKRRISNPRVQSTRAFWDMILLQARALPG